MGAIQLLQVITSHSNSASTMRACLQLTYIT